MRWIRQSCSRVSRPFAKSSSSGKSRVFSASIIHAASLGSFWFLTSAVHAVTATVGTRPTLTFWRRRPRLISYFSHNAGVTYSHPADRAIYVLCRRLSRNVVSGAVATRLASVSDYSTWRPCVSVRRVHDISRYCHRRRHHHHVLWLLITCSLVWVLQSVYCVGACVCVCVCVCVCGCSAFDSASADHWAHL